VVLNELAPHGGEKDKDGAQGKWWQQGQGWGARKVRL